jgi:large subunit ribosomal protein L10
MRPKGPRADKVEAVAEMQRALLKAKAAILTDYRGLTVAEITALRRKLGEVGGEYHVVKNTLFKRALGDRLTPEMEKLLVGPTAVAFALEDPVPMAKVLLDFLRDLRKPEIAVKGGILDGRTYTPEQVTSLSKLPPRQVVLGQALGTLQAPLSQLVGTLQGALSEFARTLQALCEKRQVETA